MDELIEIEESLREGLRHVIAPHGFTDRVMAKVEGRAQARRRWAVRPFAQPVWLAAAAALILSVTGGEVLHVRHQVQAQAAAQAQLDRALQLTSHAMNEVETGFERGSAGHYATLWNGK